MSLFGHSSKAVARSFCRWNSLRQRMIYYSDDGQIRCFGSIYGIDVLNSVGKENLVGRGSRNNRFQDYGNSSNSKRFIFQKRGFLGCGDGEEGSVLSKIYEERRVLGYSPEQLFNVVAAVDLYEGFLPWCQRSEVVRRNPDGSFDAELEIGFKFLVESYMSHVKLSKPKCIKTTSSQSSLFDHLINIWEFNPGPVPGSCSLYFLVDFKFQSPFYRQIANMFFKEVVSRLVGSFHDRCRQIYGPGVRVIENTNQQTL